MGQPTAPAVTYRRKGRWSLPHADGRALLPFVEYQTMSDANLTALISFLRSQPAVSNDVPPMDVQFKGKVALAFFVKPQGPRVTPAAVPLAARVRHAVGHVRAHDRRRLASDVSIPA
jgi:hypothetical protein